jgi:septin family protein
VSRSVISLRSILIYHSVLIIGAKNSGKTSFLNFLKTSMALPPKKRPIRDADSETPPPSAKANRNYIHHYQEAEVDNERIGLTLWDSQGLEKGVVDLQLREMSNFVESKFEDTFLEEQKVVRAPGVRDTHIHLVFFILDATRLDANIQAVSQNCTNGHGRFSKAPRIVGGLDEDFDLQVLRTLQGKTTVVPVISKADTVTTSHMAFLKKTVWESLKQAGLDPLEALGLDPEEDSNDDMNKLDEQDEDDEIEKKKSSSDVDSDDEPSSPKTEDSDTLPEEQKPNMKRHSSHKRQSSTLSPPTSMLDSGFVPLSILSPDPYSLASNEQPIGRKFPWGFADPYNPEHCDFVKLKDACFGDWRADLREASREVFYERWRTSRLNRKGQAMNGNGDRLPEPRKSSGGIPIQLANTSNRFRQR